MRYTLLSYPYSSDKYVLCEFDSIGIVKTTSKCVFAGLLLRPHVEVKCQMASSSYNYLEDELGSHSVAVPLELKLCFSSGV